LHQATYIKAEQLWQRGAALARVEKSTSASVSALPLWQGWVAACSFLVIMFGFVFWYFNPTEVTYYYQTAKGEQRELLLDDGTRLILNTQTSLSVSFTKDARRIQLNQGEAFFDVEKEKRPFEVVTDFGVVRVLGTHFSVYRQKEDAQVTVVEGKVELGHLSEDRKTFTSQTILTADQALSLNSAMQGHSPEAVNAQEKLAWRKKELVFKGERLDQVIEELNRYVPQIIALADPALGEHRLTAVVQLSDSQIMLDAVARSLNLELFRDPNDGSFILR
jgi:transmembrane sensor